VGHPARVVGVVAVALTTLVGLTACGGGNGDDAPDAAATSLPHDQTSDPGSDQSSDPYIEQENPKRFVARWAAAEARMQNTGRIAPYVALSRGCGTCRRLAHTVAGYYAAGGFIHGGAWRIDSIKAVPAPSGVVTFVVRGHSAPMTVRESSSGSVQHVPAAPISYLIGVVAKGSSFTVASRTRGA
jgi:hypothetical protein